MIQLSVNARIYQACQLDMLAGHYGLAPIRTQRRGHWFAGTEAAWRKLADDVDYRSDSGWSDGKTRRSDGLHGRISKAVARGEVQS
jgi:hypothetical protein